MPAENVRSRVWTLAHGRSLELGPQSVLMGILNVTPDSFSDGGAYRGDVPRAVDAALRMIEEGAAIIDIGGESTRPGAEPVEAEEERRRVLPVIEALASRSDCLISIDTYRSETARAAVQTGAHIVNDVWGAQRDPAIAEVAATTGAGLCLMHTGRERVRESDAIADQFQFLETSLRIAADAGVSTAQIVLDPGFGFGKDAAENINLMMRLDELKAFGYPLLVGTSRKRFVRSTLGHGEADADVATAATSVLLRERGAAIFRVHRIGPNRDALAMVDAGLHAMAMAK
ncbi:dihydropteroate synthase [Aureimonas ureilytica]|uniref:Dihydropteroate synthase n=1 Tax=Aureimonas ureilytica TaxID=401562 RepID=A0A175R7Q8_9HYPH|nr:dihydropteroate synthase [Aureimonas ureilytica]KTQ95225.1 dihydropteroate synthase [Aureimonas ureilytica]